MHYGVQHLQQGTSGGVFHVVDHARQSTSAPAVHQLTTAPAVRGTVTGDTFTSEDERSPRQNDVEDETNAGDATTERSLNRDAAKSETKNA